jgi:hypothetical protein
MEAAATDLAEAVLPAAVEASMETDPVARDPVETSRARTEDVVVLGVAAVPRLATPKRLKLCYREPKSERYSRLLPPIGS